MEMNSFESLGADSRVVEIRPVSADNEVQRRHAVQAAPTSEAGAGPLLQLVAAAALCTAYTVSNELTRRATDSQASRAEIRQVLAQMTSTLGFLAVGALPSKKLFESGESERRKSEA